MVVRVIFLLHISHRLTLGLGLTLGLTLVSRLGLVSIIFSNDFKSRLTTLEVL